MSSNNVISVTRAALAKAIEAEKERFASGKLNPQNIERATGYILGLKEAQDIITKSLSHLN